MSFKPVRAQIVNFEIENPTHEDRAVKIDDADITRLSEPVLALLDKSIVAGGKALANFYGEEWGNDTDVITSYMPKEANEIMARYGYAPHVIRDQRYGFFPVLQYAKGSFDAEAWEKMYAFDCLRVHSFQHDFFPSGAIEYWGTKANEHQMMSWTNISNGLEIRGTALRMIRQLTVRPEAFDSVTVPRGSDSIDVIFSKDPVATVKHNFDLNVCKTFVKDGAIYSFHPEAVKERKVAYAFSEKIQFTDRMFENLNSRMKKYVARGLIQVPGSSVVKHVGQYVA